MDPAAVDDSLLSVVSAKFASDETIIGILEDAALVGPKWMKRERILAIVRHIDEEALFVLLSVCFPPTSFLDLSIESVLPIDSDFKCDIEDTSHLVITCRRSKLHLEIKQGIRTSHFVDTLFRAIDSSISDTKQFTWLRKYSNSRKNEDASKMVDIDSPDIFDSRQNVARGLAPMAARDNMIKYHMELKEHEYIFTQPFNIFVGTWNVNGQSPTQSLKKWLCSDVMPPDIYAIGFQELDLSKEALLFDYTPREVEWCEALIAGIDERAHYERVNVVRLVGMMLIIFVKKQHLDNIKNLAWDTVGTGIMGKMGNKGGVTIRFDFHNTSICFVNSHLAAHVEEYERRNQDYREICNRTQFNQFDPPKRIEDHDQIYWLGDLNYRITEMNHVIVKKLLKEGNIEAVLTADQLKIQQGVKHVLNGYTEGPITFQPTYKYDPGTDMWDSSEKERAPAWCDRILWKGDSIKQTSYRSHPELNISDHKPVSALFISGVKVVDIKKYRKVHEDVIKKLDKIENEFLPHVTVEPTEIVFEKVKYLEPQTREVCIANTGQVPVRFEFIKKLEELSYCKNWLNIEPHIKNINPGDKCDVKLEVFVDKNSAYKLNYGQDKLYDILVLHLDGGKDIFITVGGTYEKSCFGTSIETLVHLKAPVREIFEINMESSENSVYYLEDGYDIPKEIWYLVDHIHTYGLKEPDLFEYPGLHSELLRIRDWLDNGSDEKMPGTIHSVVNALLLLLESTAEPIIPYNHHYACLNASNNYVQCKQIIMQLPMYKKNVFLYLCLFLQEVLIHSSENGTNAKKLAELFSSVFLRDSLQNKAKTFHDKRNIENKKRAFIEHFLVNDPEDMWEIR